MSEGMKWRREWRRRGGVLGVGSRNEQKRGGRGRVGKVEGKLENSEGLRLVEGK